jgi:uncharacterized protein YjbI with pentapeptide repeats
MKIFKNTDEIDKDFSGQDLRGRQFKNQDLTKADFSDCDLRGAYFSGANLAEAKFCRARMGRKLNFSYSTPLIQVASFIIAFS